MTGIAAPIVADIAQETARSKPKVSVVMVSDGQHE